jgi:Oxidoreductase molybdopterin binding domain
VTWASVFRRAGRRTNLALLTLLIGAFGTGWLAFAAGTPVPARLATVAHGVFGLGVIALVPWKRVVISRAGPMRLASLALLVLVIVCLVAGFVEVFVGYTVVATLSPIQVHVGSAVVAVPLFVWHLLRHRGQRPRQTDLSRRNLIRTGAFALGIGAGYAALTGVGQLTGGPAATRLSTGSHAIDPDAIPATIWLLDRVPVLDIASHRVDVAGTLLSADELEARAGAPLVARLDCTSGWYADATWTGVALSELIPAEGLRSAESIVVISVTGYRRHFPVADADALWLATRCEGRLLSAGGGAPVRLVARNRRGFWWVKWVASVQLSSEPAVLQSPFPLQ